MNLVFKELFQIIGTKNKLWSQKQVSKEEAVSLLYVIVSICFEF